MATRREVLGRGNAVEGHVQSSYSIPQLEKGWGHCQVASYKNRRRHVGLAKYMVSKPTLQVDFHQLNAVTEGLTGDATRQGGDPWGERVG